MRYLYFPVLLAVALAFASSIASEENAPESVQLLPDSGHFNNFCENLMSQVVQQGEVKFAESSADLGTNAMGMLDEIVEIAFDCPALFITITGHTDNTGNEAANRALSEGRAESVVAYLTEHGIDVGRLKASGVGSDSPIASNENRAGRQINRRIEFELSFE